MPTTEPTNHDSSQTETASTAASLSVVIPFYNEAGNIEPLIAEVHQALTNYAGSWELIAINDGSRDNTARELESCRQKFGPHVALIHFARNFGQTAAMQAGIEAAEGELIVTMDGDRQNDPADIPKMIEMLCSQDLDMVSGWRQNRQDAGLTRKLPSLLANRLIRKTTGVIVHDYGCSLKLFRARVIKQVYLIGEMHRFIPAWVASVTDPQRIGEMVVNHRAREVGQSKYGLSRTFRVILDLLSMVFFLRFARRPGHFFGSIGLASGFLGALCLGYLLILKLFTGADIGSRPLLFAGILLAITGIQLITTGVLAELLTRNGPQPNYTQSANTLLSGRNWHENSQS